MKKIGVLLKSKKAVAIIFIMVALAMVFIFFWQKDEDDTINDTPMLIVETPQKLSMSDTDTDTFAIDVIITDFGEEWYPAASFSISFDALHLEFMGVKEGNVFVRNDIGNNSVKQKLPQWSYNTEQCNKSGIINIMYLDTTGGKKAFSKELLANDNNVVLRLEFRLRGSARAGDVYELIVEDAVFAATDETQSLSVVQDTLKIKNGRIVVGE